MASIASRRLRLNQQIESSQKRLVALDDQIGQLMNKRVDREEHIAECMAALSHLDELEKALPNG